MNRSVLLLLMATVCAVLIQPVASVKFGPVGAGEPASVDMNRPGFIEASNLEVDFDCPEASDPVLSQRTPCPIRLASRDHMLGSPALVIQPDIFPTRFTIAALGGTLVGSPTPASRGGTAPHLLLTSETAGLTYTMYPFEPPEPGLQAEEIDLVSDASGNLALGVLYSKREGSSFAYSIAVWKLGAFPGTSGLASSPTTFTPWVSEAVLSNLNLIHVPGADEFVLFWEEEGTPPGNLSQLGPTNWIRAAWTSDDVASAWEVIAPDATLGPCGRLSNPVTWHGRVWMACSAQDQFMKDVVFLGNFTLRPEDIAVHEFLLNNRTFAFHRRGPLFGTSVLGMTPDGVLGAVAWQTIQGGTMRALYSYHDLTNNMSWSLAEVVSESLHSQVYGGTPIRSAEFLTMGYRARSGNFHLFYEEFPSTPPAFPQEVNQPRYQKVLAELPWRGLPPPPPGSPPRTPDPMFVLPLNVDQPATRLTRNPDPRSLNDPIPDDGPDDLAYAGTREFAVYSDAGTLVFAELTGEWQSVGDSPPNIEGSISEELWHAPPRDFTLPFIIASGAIALGATTRVLVGRMILKTKVETPGDTK